MCGRGCGGSLRCRRQRPESAEQAIYAFADHSLAERTEIAPRIAPASLRKGSRNLSQDLFRRRAFARIVRFAKALFAAIRRVRSGTQTEAADAIDGSGEGGKTFAVRRGGGICSDSAASRRTKQVAIGAKLGNAALDTEPNEPAWQSLVEVGGAFVALLRRAALDQPARQRFRRCGGAFGRWRRRLRGVPLGLLFPLPIEAPQ